MNFTTNENHTQQAARTASRHERVPSAIVMLFNYAGASFTLTHGDIATLPESEHNEIRSLTSGAVLAVSRLRRRRVRPLRISRVPIRLEVGAEHGLVPAAYRVTGISRSASTGRTPRLARCAAQVNPWLAYGCGRCRLPSQARHWRDGGDVQRTLRATRSWSRATGLSAR